MPQMSPMLWLILYVYFLMMSLLSMITLYYLAFIFKMTTKKIKLSKIFKFIFKW